MKNRMGFSHAAFVICDGSDSRHGCTCLLVKRARWFRAAMTRLSAKPFAAFTCLSVQINQPRGSFSGTGLKALALTQRRNVFSSTWQRAATSFVLCKFCVFIGLSGCSLQFSTLTSAVNRNHLWITLMSGNGQRERLQTGCALARPLSQRIGGLVRPFTDRVGDHVLSWTRARESQSFEEVRGTANAVGVCNLIPDRLASLIASGKCVLFLGAGTTREAGGPTGSELAQLLANKFQKTDIHQSDLRRFSDILVETSDVDREDVDATVIDALKTLVPSDAHLALPAFCWQAMFTTNYDRLVEIAYDLYRSHTRSAPSQDCNVVHRTRDQANRTDPTVVNLYKMHGCVAAIKTNNPLVLTSNDYRNTIGKRKRMLRTLKTLAAEHAVLFMGFSFTDANIFELLEDLKEQSATGTHRRMYTVIPSVSESEKEFYNSKNIEVVPH